MGRGVATIRYAEDILYFHFSGNVYGEYNPETDEYCQRAVNFAGF